MKDSLSLIEVLAVVVRRGKAILASMLVFALLLGGFQAYRQISKANSPENSPEKIEERYQAALSSYSEEKEYLEKEIADTDRQREMKQEYIDNSLHMKLDPYHEIRTYLHVAVVDVEEDAFQQVFRMEDTPVDYLITKIQDQYTRIWGVQDLSTVIDLPAYQDFEEKYLWEVVNLSSENSGMFTITADANTVEESQALALCVYNWMLSQREIISEASYKHGLALVNQTTKTIVNTDLETKQSTLRNELRTLSDTLDDLNKQLSALAEPTRESGYSAGSIIKSTIKYAILGAIIGLFLACAVVFMLALFRNRLEISYQLEQGLDIPFLGSLAPRGDLFNRLSSRISSERTWKDHDQALTCVAEKSRLYLEGKQNIVLLTTQLIGQDAPVVQELLEMLSKDGRTVHFVNDAAHNPQPVTSIPACDSVVFAEKAGRSSLISIADAAALVRKFDKPIDGFVLI